MITNGGGAVFTNSGTMDNDADSNFVLDDFAKLINNWILHQRRVFNPSSRSGGIVDQKGGTLVNSGTSNQGGEGGFANLTGSKIINSGRINMFVSLLDNRGTIEIFHFGACQNLAGKLGNKTGGALVIAGTVANFDSNTINSSGLIIKDRNLVNAGRMNNLYGGTVTVCSIN